MKKRKRIGLFTEGTVTIHPLSETKREKGTWSFDLLTALWSCLGITLLLAGILVDICRVWNLDWNNIWLLFLLLMSAGAVLLTRLSKQHRFVHLAAAIVLLIVGFAWQKELLSGCYEAANAFLSLWNQYYGMQLPAFSIEEISGWEITVLYLAAWISLYLSFLQGRRVARLGIVAIGLLPVALGLLVGVVPNLAAFICMLLGSVCLISGMTSRKISSNRTSMYIISKNNLLAGGIFLIALLTYAVAGARVRGVLLEHHDKVLAYQKNLEQQIQNINIPSSSAFQDGAITNRKVTYTGKEIFQVTLDRKPDSILYFRGFVGDIYQDGVWAPVDEVAFEKETKVWVPTPEDAGSFILNYSHVLLSSVTPLDEENPMKIVYTNTSGSYAYIPYYANIRDTDPMKKLYVKADAIIYRRKSCNSVQFNVFSPQEDVLITEPDSMSHDRLRDNYLSYAMEHYTQTSSEGIARLAKLANTWRAEGNGVAEGTENEDFAYDIPIAKVRKELYERTDYSRNLDAVPSGEDVVENFVFDSKEGYCIHYASAATLLLRYLGVPARYVEGYAVKPQEFKENADGTYTADVLDYDGHAWTEVYKDVRGWVPVDMTKGTAGGGYVEDDSNTESSTTSEKVKNEEPITPDTAQTNQTTKQGQKTHTASTAALTWKQILRSAILLLVLVVTVAGLGYLLWIKTSCAREMMHLRRYFSSHDTRKAVLAYSHAIYQKLLHAGVIQAEHMWDDDYVQLLEEKLTFLKPGELRSFLECAKKAAFSPYQPAKEEVEEGHKVYHQICEAIHDGRLSK